MGIVVTLLAALPRNPAFRVLSRYVFGQTRSLEAYLVKLGAALS